MSQQSSALLQKSCKREAVHQWPGSQMAFRAADAVSSASLPEKRVGYGDSFYKYENSNISERIVMKSDISHEDLQAFLCSSWHIQWFQLISHKARVFLSCLVRHTYEHLPQI